eukprot:gene12609-14799_t
MESFNTFLFETYKELNLYVTEEYPDLEPENADFLAIGRDIVERAKEAPVLMANQLLEYVMCLCFFSGNKDVWRPLVTEHIGLFANKIISKNFTDGIPFCFAIPFGDRDLLVQLADLGMDLTLSLDNSYVMTSALYGNTAAFDFFTDRGAPLNHRNNNGDTALLFAAMNGELGLVERLIKLGEDLRVVNAHGFNVFVCAAFHDQHATIALLAKAIERLHGRKQLREMLDYRDKDGETPLHISARLGFVQTVRVLLELGCEINLGNRANQTPLDLARKAMVSARKETHSQPSNSTARSRLTAYQEEMKSLEFIQRLLPASFKERLFTKPNPLNIVVRSPAQYQKIIALFDECIKKKEIEISKKLESLDLEITSFTSSSSSTAAAAKKKAAKKATKKAAAAKSKPTPTSPPLLTTSKQPTSMEAVQPDKQVDNQQDEEVEVVAAVNSPQQPQPQQQQQEEEEEEEEEQQGRAIDYKEKYEALALMYLDQADRLKQALCSLTDVETTFNMFNQSLYEKNLKAEALGLGIPEILGVGLEYLSQEQLTVLSSIHQDSIQDIELAKQNSLANSDDLLPCLADFLTTFYKL